MKEKEAKNIDKLVDKMMVYSSLETPSINFPNAVMKQVLAISENKVITYKPLISKTVWVFILLGFIATIIFVIFGTKTKPSGWLNVIDFSILSENKIRNLLANLKFPNLTISKTFGYAFMFLSVMVCVQISILKHYLNQRFEN